MRSSQRERIQLVLPAGAVAFTRPVGLQGEERTRVAGTCGGRGEALRVVKPAARDLQQPIVIGLAAWAALKMDRGAGKFAGGVLAGEFPIDVRVEDLQARGAASVALLGTQQLVKLSTTIDHALALSSTTACPAAARPLRSVRLASNRFWYIAARFDSSWSASPG